MGLAVLAAGGAGAAGTTALAQVPAGTTTQRVGTGFSNPIFATAPAGDTGRLFVVEQGSGTSAQIRVLNLADNTVNPTPFLTVNNIVAGGEQGLLGMAFHPDFAANGRFFVNVTAPGGAFGSGVTQIREYVVPGPNPLLGNAATAAPVQTLLSFDQPQTNHNGGWIGFSPRGAGDAGNLYIASGDGGNGNDQGTGHTEPNGNAQDTNSLLGKILRVNVDTDAFPADAGRNYGIPGGASGNPFAAGGGAPEVFAVGLRNPFRASFDRSAGHLYIGDVGQGAREEVDFQSAARPGGGDNYQWRFREGSIQTPGGGVGGPAPAGSSGPIDDYDRTVGTTITGGYVYRGTDVAGLDGTYLYADFGNGKLFALRHDGTAVTVPRADVTALLAPGGGLSISNPSSFAQDGRGEMYILDYADGEVYRIVPEPAAGVFALAAIAAALSTRSRRVRHKP